jgi:hypothetical protein
MAEPSEDTLKLIGFSSNVVFKKSKAARIFSKGKTLAKENVTLKQLATAALGKIPLIGGALSAAAGAGAGIYQSDQLAKKAEAARIRCAEVEGMLNDDAAAEATKLASGTAVRRRSIAPMNSGAVRTRKKRHTRAGTGPRYLFIILIGDPMWRNIA